MLARIVIAATLVLATMLAVKNGWVLRRTGLIGSCHVFMQSAGGARWEVCKPGALLGRPKLHGCTSQWTSGRLESWYCPPR